MTGVMIVSTQTSASANCTSHIATLVDGTSGYLVNGSNVNFRTGPHTSCSSRGLGQRSTYVTYYCYTRGDTVTANGVTLSTWTMVHRDGQLYGWVSDTLLVNYGSPKLCP
ncbi:hypothetical protein GA0070603_3183 [Micromonospora chersina]|uniref:SH3 domain-containing protein n=1 Tax=Micromonospora chersina TaxID=47854 RepID=A0A1C6V4K9_9ACTN|nr:hypothetical protein GA0070603_3183 [Micromonospora chersina]